MVIDNSLSMCRELREGAKRSVQQRQMNNLQAALIDGSTKAGATAVRRHNQHQQEHQRQDYLKAYDQKVQDLTQRTHSEQQADFQHKSAAAAAVHEQETRRREAHRTVAYVPGSGGQTNMKERLLALGRGEHVTAQ